ncbi:phospholipase A2 [Pseudonocardia pini]|uniref:phospholipase A2 n=1 Tax=Pseudonocardia pini TaxID=2758030 RepID=UPI001C68CC28|nr:phospholipase A2 [Pseudonocardia pini]
MRVAQVGSSGRPQVVRLVVRVLVLAVVSGVLLGGTAGQALAYTAADRRVQTTYARETVGMTSTQFLSRKADFQKAGCRIDGYSNNGFAYPGCRKPSPYDAFDWSDDGCSGREVAGVFGRVVSNAYRDVFNGPCQLHDFGYRNFGAGLQLGRDETTRAWIDDRFRTEMNRVCDTRYSGAQRVGCRVNATTVWTVVRNASSWKGPADTAPAPLDEPSATPPAAAPSRPVFPVMNTSEQPPDGVWFRNSARVADTDRLTGHGIYGGDRVRLDCHVWGEAVGPHGNRLWYRASNVTRPTVGSRPNDGFVNAHYVDDRTTANQVAGGVPAC